MSQTVECIRGWTSSVVWLSCALMTAAPFQGQTPSSLSDRLSELLASGKLAETTDSIEQFLESSRLADGPSLEHAALLDQIASHAIETEQEPAALALEVATASVQIKLRELGEDHPDGARSMTNLGWILVGHNRFEEAGESLRRALRIQESSADPSIDLAFTLEGLAWQTAWVSGFEGSEPFCRRALEVYRAVEAGPGEELQCRGWIAAARHNAGDLEGALSMQRENIELAEQHFGPSTPEVGTMLSELAGTYLNLGDYQSASITMERSLAALRSAVTLHNAADLFASLGWYSRALELAQEATALWEASSADANDVSVAIGLRMQGRVLLRLGSDESVDIFERALDIARSRLEPDNTQVLGYLINLGTAERVFGLPAARSRLEEALSLARTVSNRSGTASTANILLELGRLESEAGNLERSQGHLEESVRLTREAFGDNHFEMGNRLVELASVLLRSGDLEGAEKLLTRASGIAAEAGLENHPLMTRIRTLQSQLALGFGRADEALALASAAVDVLVNQARIVSSLPERHATTYYSSRARPEAVLVAGALELPEEERGPWLSAVARWTLQRRARVLEHVSARHLAGSDSSDPEIREAWVELVRARQELARLWVASVDSPRIDQVAKALRAARAAVDDAEVTLAKVTGDDRLAEWDDEEPIEVSALQRGLPEGAALVEFIRAPSLDGSSHAEARDTALILTEEGLQLVDIGTAETVDEAVASWRNELLRTRSPRASMDEVVESAQSVRRLVWDPLAKRLDDDVRRVLVVPDGAIFHVHFAALTQDDDRYLIEDGWQFHILSSARDLVRSVQEPASSGVLAMGAPDYSAPYQTRVAALGVDGVEEVTAAPSGYRGDSCVSDREWPELAGARLEVLMLADILDEEVVTALVGSSASEERFKLEAQNKRWLHLATHGFYDATTEDCESKQPLVGDLGLLRSGLVLAGANGGDNDWPGADDGILTAEEILTLDLSEVEMAVLSACDTGLGGIVVGEGVFGLRRAFEVAGARTVVQSLWPLPDRFAQQFMTAFYNGLRESNDVVATLHQSSLSILAERRRSGYSVHPYYWTGLVSSGEWELEDTMGSPLGR